MKTIKLVILSFLLVAVPYSISAESISLEVGQSKTLKAPSSPSPSTHPVMSAQTYWTLSGPVEVVYGLTSGAYASAITIKATGTGSAEVTCVAYYWNPNGTIYDGRKRAEKTWYIDCYGDDPIPDPGPNPNPDDAYTAPNYYTLTSLEGIPMSYELSTSLNSNNSRWYVGVKAKNGAAISVETSGRVTIPEIVPGTQNCIVKMQNPYRTWTLSEGLCVNYIGASAFKDCKNLTGIAIPSTVTSIASGAFSGCTGLQYIIIDAQKPPQIMSSYFPAYIYSNVKVIVPKGCKSSYQNAQYWSKFGDNIQEEGESQYNDGDIFTEKTREGVEMKFQVVSASKKTCNVYGKLTWSTGEAMTGEKKGELCIDENTRGSITIPESVKGYKVTGISHSAFYGCSEVTSFSLPSSITYIGQSAFAYCTGITSITLPSSLIEIGMFSFYGCSNLKSVEIPDGVLYIRDQAFSGCTNLTSVSIPNSVDRIQQSAFNKCSGLTKITIPSSVTFLVYPFSYCTNLSSITVDKNNTVFDSRDNCNAIIEKATNKLVVGCKSTEIPSSVTCIGNRSFLGQGTLTSITIPKSIKSIEGYAFYRCDGLNKVISQIEEPFDIEESVFSNYDTSTKTRFFTNATLYVPKGTKSIYLQAEGWKEFKKIVETEEPQPDSEMYYYVGSRNGWNIADTSYPFTKQRDGKTWELTMPCSEEMYDNQADMFKIGTAASLVVGWEAEVYGAPEDDSSALSGTMTKNYGPNFEVPFIEGMYSYTVSIIPSTMHYEIVVNKTTPTPKSRFVNTSLAGYATFYDSQDNYSLPTGLTAQVVTGISGGKLTYKTLSGSVVPKGTAVMLKGSGDRTYTLTSTTESASYTGTNCLRGSDNATTTTGDGYHYKLCYGSSGSSLSSVFGWYWGASNGGSFRMDGHKAWLVLPKSSTRAEGFTVEGDATSIDDLQIDDSQFVSPVYDLMGRRVSQPTRKGLYLQHGKKVIKK